MTGFKPPVRDIGTVKDVHGYVIRVGVDHGAVTIGGAPYAMLGPEVRDDFVKLFMEADTEAKAYEAALAETAEEDAAADPDPVLADSDCPESKMANGNHDSDWYDGGRCYWCGDPGPADGKER